MHVFVCVCVCVCVCEGRGEGLGRGGVGIENKSCVIHFLIVNKVYCLIAQLW